jgi:phage terminase large subunit
LGGFLSVIGENIGKIWIDYNPSDSFHWIYDRLTVNEMTITYIQSTYKDNPFLDATIVDEIERLRGTDDDYWRIYGLGERGMSRATIFQFQVAEEPKGQLISLGLDFGFTNDPTSLVKVFKDGDNLYIQELLYHTNLTNQDISQKLTELGLTRFDEIWAD